MLCRGSILLNGCGKCKVSISDNEFIKNLYITSLVKINALIVNNGIFNDVRSHENNKVDICITCNGNVLVSAKYPKYNVPFYRAKQTSIMILNKWYEYNNIKSPELIPNIFTSTISKLMKTDNPNTFRATCVYLGRTVFNNYSCKGACTTLVLNKKISTCLFSLTDIQRVCKVNETNLISIICTVLYVFRKRDKDKVFIDLTNTYIRCNGEMLSDKRMVKCASTFSTCKKFCIRYLTAWCEYNHSNNISKSKSVKLLKLIDNKNSILGLYDICSKFSE